jgi:hypothetical protein
VALAAGGAIGEATLRGAGNGGVRERLGDESAGLGAFEMHGRGQRRSNEKPAEQKRQKQYFHFHHLAFAAREEKSRGASKEIAKSGGIIRRGDVTLCILCHWCGREGGVNAPAPIRRSPFADLALALFHDERASDRFMAMTAYFDESGTHGADSPATIFGGFLAREGLWYIFEERLKQLFQKYGVETFHTKDYRQRRGRFREMNIEEYSEFNSSFLQLVDSCLMRGFVIVLPSKSYNEIYRPRFHKKKRRPDSAYGLCFRTAISRSILYLNSIENEYPFTPILESGHRNAPDALRIYNEFIEGSGEAGRECLKPILFEDKKKCLSLAAADSIVYCMYRKVAGLSEATAHPHAVPMGPASPPYYVGADPAKAQVTRIDISDEILDYLSSDFT